MMAKQDNKYFEYLCIISMLSMAIMLCDAVLVYKIIKMPFGYTSACAFVFPFWFVISDIITEVYGKSISKKILWFSMLFEILFSLVCHFLVNLKSPSFSHNQIAFDLVLGHLPRIVLSSFLAIILAGYLNIYLVSKWKKMLNGRYFWLRSIGASWIGEAAYTCISIFCMMYGAVSFTGIWLIIFWSYLIKIVITILLAGPASMITGYLKTTNKNSNNIEFNPFNTDSLEEI